MSNILILAPLPIAGVTGPGTAPANLLTPDPREAWIAPGGNPALTIDLGVAATFDTVFLGYVAVPAGQITLQADTVLGAANLAPARLVSRPAHALLVLAQPVTARNLTLTVAAGAAFSAGILMIGDGFTPGWNYEWGAGRTPIDTGTRDRLQGGGFAIDLGIRKSSWQCTLGDLTDDEREQLYAIALDRGQTQPVLLVEDPAQTAGLAERIHYGTFDRIEVYERKDADLNSWAVRVEDWV